MLILKCQIISQGISYDGANKEKCPEWNVNRIRVYVNEERLDVKMEIP